MVFIFDGSSEHGACKWSKSKYFDLLKAYGYIYRVVKLEFLSQKTNFLSYVRNMFWATILYRYQGLSIGPDTTTVWQTRAEQVAEQNNFFLSYSTNHMMDVVKGAN